MPQAHVGRDEAPQAVILGALMQTVTIAASENDPATLRAAKAAMQAVPTAFRSANAGETE